MGTILVSYFFSEEQRTVLKSFIYLGGVTFLKKGLKEIEN
jgi:hypothetical protein